MKALIPVLFLAPTLALAAMPCAHENRSELQLDLDDIRVLQVAIGPDKLRLVGAPDGDGRLSVRGCASSAERLAQLSLEPERAGDGVLKLVRETGGSSSVRFNLFGRGSGNYGYFEIEGRIPDTLAIDLAVGSGDAWIHNVQSLDATVGSGDLEARDVAGLFKARVGSGDIEARNVGRAEIGSIGSGDVELYGVAGDVSVGSIGSGDLDLRDVEGSVDIGSIGSGDAELQRIAGSVSVRTLGSGDVRAYDVGGDVSLSVKGSGDVRTRNVAGNVDVPRRR
ncbi:hypothetical protein [Alkalisalibacterium limincola]|uniref:Auto-transporter adhesin head GIN domain-containing protein n=1 Tax=Alkalisalibacterium limincola TaxID=2699169 RepID=A0A5C8KJG4_9GAMM|nr:hypothetical protein [Alkalisalibacterium limincola]TXK59639.1 hypothetical protein FU658_13420 [Alkalisalibacterium limincola]